MKRATKILLKAAELYESGKVAWNRGHILAIDGSMCIMGVVGYAAPIRHNSGVWQALALACRVDMKHYHNQKGTITWNDTKCKNKEQAIDMLLFAASISESNVEM